MFALVALALLSTNGFAQNYVCDNQGFSPMEIKVATSGTGAQLVVVRGTGQSPMLNPEGESANLSLTRSNGGWVTYSGISKKGNLNIRYMEFRAPESDLHASSGAFRATLDLGPAGNDLSGSTIWPYDMVCQKLR